MDILDEVIRLGITPDIVTDQTATEPMNGYIPVGLSVDEAFRMRTEDPSRLLELVADTVPPSSRNRAYRLPPGVGVPPQYQGNSAFGVCY